MSETLKYDNLFAGDFDVITEEITIDESQTILRGDLLVKTAGKWGRPSAVITFGTANMGTGALTGASANTETGVITGGTANTGTGVVTPTVVCVASEDVTTGSGVNKTSIGYKTGSFNSNSMRFGGASTAADNKDLLASKSIYITAATA